MAKRVDLGNGMWIDLREDLTMAEIEGLIASARRYDTVAGVHYTDEHYAAIESISLLGEAWGIEPAMEMTSDSIRKMPLAVSARIVDTLATYMKFKAEEARQGWKSPDFSDASANSPS